ncbi:uncharacterized protein [Rutidosis leptorrhynchoides]|uniref:uncharacterized protein n=1 Tax=Rutidosis leptorrhynchoides TaxID=125765 RepID=UPI003A995914
MAANQEFVPLNLLNGETLNPSIRVKVFCLWNRTYWNSPSVVASTEMVLMDQQGNKIVAQIPKKLITFFGRTFVEGSYFDLTGFAVVQYEDNNYKMANHSWKVLILRQTSVRRTESFDLPVNGFFTVNYDDVNQWVVDPTTAFGMLLCNEFC